MFKELLSNVLDIANKLFGKAASSNVGTPTPVQQDEPAHVILPATKESKVGMVCETIEDLMSNLDLEESIKWSMIVVHHSEAKDDGNKSEFEGIRNYHTKEKGWSEIGYAVVIEKVNGKYVYRIGRPLSTTQAHSQGFNKTAPGFCCLGNFDKQAPNEEQWKMMLDLVKAFMIQFSIPSKKVYGHRETFALRGLSQEKSCPGAMWDMDRFRSEL